MIPMADNLNHSAVSMTFEIVTKSKQLEADEKSAYFSRSKFMNNYSEIFSEEEI